jgi:hypothetical protein
MRKGLPDYQYPLKNATYASLWLEMKRIDQREKEKKPEQDAWLEKLRKAGHYATYAYGCEDAIRIYNDYINDRLS